VTTSAGSTFSGAFWLYGGVMGEVKNLRRQSDNLLADKTIITCNWSMGVQRVLILSFSSHYRPMQRLRITGE
jgi:hypothetical protein